MIEKIIIIALIVQFIHYTMQPGEIFGALGDWFERHLPNTIHAPVFECPICMTPWYGTFIYALLWLDRKIENLFPFLFTLFAAAGLNIFLNAFINRGTDEDSRFDG